MVVFCSMQFDLDKHLLGATLRAGGMSVSGMWLLACLQSMAVSWLVTAPIVATVMITMHSLLGAPLIFFAYFQSVSRSFLFPSSSTFSRFLPPRLLTSYLFVYFPSLPAARRRIDRELRQKLLEARLAAADEPADESSEERWEQNADGAEAEPEESEYSHKIGRYAVARE